MERIPIREIEFNTYSSFDDVGRVFSWRDRLFRAIRPHKVSHIKKLFESGLIASLVNENLFPKSWITDYSIEGFPLIVEHERVSPVTFSYEWSFSMLKEAALTVLKTNLIAQKYGYQLKDCHGSNILFNKLLPVFIDLGSFVPLNKDLGWTAYEEFVRFYYYPLRIWSSGDSYVGRMSLFAEHGMMPHSSYYSYRFYIPKVGDTRTLVNRIVSFYYGHLRLGPSSVEKYSGRFSKNLGGIVSFLYSKHILPCKKVNMPCSLKKIKKIKRPKSSSPWASYHKVYLDANGEIKKISPRFARIIDIINSHSDIKSIIDIGSNEGIFSMMLLEKTRVNRIICMDYDEYAVDKMYMRFKNRTRKVDAVVLQNLVLPVVTRDVPRPNERFMSDAVVALALTHHLILSQHITIEKVFSNISAYSKKYVFIEFMPRGLHAGRNSLATPTWYTEHWFRRHFVQFFKLIAKEELDKNRVLFFGSKL